jgi:hypothetical protein
MAGYDATPHATHSSKQHRPPYAGKEDNLSPHAYKEWDRKGRRLEAKWTLARERRELADQSNHIKEISAK